MSSFSTKGYQIVKNFIPEEEIIKISKYFENCVNQNLCIDRSTDDSPESKISQSQYYRYADPLTEVVLEDKCEEIERITKTKLYPTYSYMRVYMGADDLSAHTDRPECEYSVTVHVAKIGEDWPIGIKDIDGQDHEFVLEAGDALIYRGCDLLHWRRPMSETKTNLNVQFMLHYVDKTGPYSILKWDKRPRLGLCDNTKMR